jgi:hypothetical protein
MGWDGSRPGFEAASRTTNSSSPVGVVPLPEKLDRPKAQKQHLDRVQTEMQA